MPSRNLTNEVNEPSADDTEKGNEEEDEEKERKSERERETDGSVCPYLSQIFTTRPGLYYVLIDH